MTSATDILAISLSIPALVLCGMVLAHWLPEARRAIQQRRDAADWLVLGVAVSFAGIMINISWWAAYWWLRVMDAPAQVWWLDNGSSINLVSRQGAVIVAAWCHLRAYHMFSQQKTRDPNIHLMWTMGAMALATLALFLTKGGLAP